MGTLPFLQSKRQFTRQHFQQSYTQTIPPEYFNFHCSRGFRNSSQENKQHGPLPEIMTSPLYELALKKRTSKTMKKAVNDSSVYPFSCIGLLLVYFGEVLKCGTGSLIGKNLIITAASNVFDKETQKIATSLKFVLDLNGQTGHIYQISKDKIHFHEKFSEEIEGSHRYNYAFLQIDSPKGESAIQEEQSEKGLNDLSCNPGLTHGYLGFTTDFRGMEPVFVFGYSGEYNENGVEYKLRGQKIEALVCKNSALGYKMQSCPSEVGSPIMIKRKDLYEIVGIHMGGKKGLSCGLQFDQQIRADLNSWAWQMQGSIDLKQKGLSDFQVNLFSGFEWHNMVTINLDNNNITCQGLAHLTKNPWPMLRELHLSNNNIGALSFDVSSIINVQKLYLNGNDLKEVTPLSGLPLLVVLCIADNRVNNIDQLFELKHLQRLDASHNKLRTIGSEIVKLTKLQKFYLSRNELTGLPVEILKMRSLKVIVVDRNKFNPSPTELFARLERQHVQVVLQ